MTEDVAHIAIVSPNAAFSAFAEAVLASWPDIAVHAFADAEALGATRFIPSVVACNFEFDSGFYESLAPVLLDFRRTRPVATLAIVRCLDGWTRARCKASGIDEVVVKPISPLHLGLRLATLAAGRPSTPASVRRSADILPFPARRASRAPGFRPFAS